ncbi:MAG: HAMP domain-containing histidine kinase [Chloroflexi bacterium]|nr:HAMP domain-containing histidine kinase [Chloroflexota bacterium]
MRSISVKITLVLVVVSLVGALFTSFYIQNQTKTAFDTFIKDQDEQVLVKALTNYYQENQSWDGVDQVFSELALYSNSNPGSTDAGGNNPNRPYARAPLPFVLSLDTGLIIAGGVNHVGYQTGDVIPENELRDSAKLEYGGKFIGYLIAAPSSQLRNNPQQSFLNTVQQGLMISSLVTLLIALTLGGFLIQSFTRPIRKLANATEAVASGDLGYQVDIHTKDELGKLADSFNRMSADLEKSDQARKQMTADIAHDLRTPLTIMQGYTEALNEGKMSSSQEIYQVMHQQTKHLNYLIDDLKTLSLLDSEELTFQVQNIDPTIILNHIEVGFSPLVKEKKIQLSVNKDQDLPRVKLDPDRLTQVLGNLINNAIQVLPPGGKIELTAKSDAKNLILQVADNGPGISENDLPLIFNRSFRTDKSRASNQGSSGLGLSITKKLVESQGGLITVQSKVGSGTTFQIKFPSA